MISRMTSSYPAPAFADAPSPSRSPRAETAVHNFFLFTGQMLDVESGLYHYKAHAYHPTLGSSFDVSCSLSAADLGAAARGSAAGGGRTGF